MSRTELIDVSVRLGPGLPVWPGSRGLHLERTRSIDRGDDVNESFLACDVHSGTHIDAPFHFLKDGSTVDQIPLETLVGPAHVVDLRGSEEVTPDLLDTALNEIDIQRLLIRSGNSDLWEGSGRFVPSYTALTPSAAEWLVRRRVLLVGIDYLSIDLFGCAPEVHNILLRAGVVIVEGLNLSHVQPGPWEILCLPLRLVGGEAAPARVALRREVDA